MLRFLIVAAVFLPALAQAETATERAARCESQSQIVAQAVSLRAEGKRENRAIRDITKARADLDTPYTDAISPLVGWIYTLPADQLTDAPRTEFLTACAGYKP